MGFVRAEAEVVSLSRSGPPIGKRAKCKERPITIADRRGSEE
jgi:hypothetical protein